MSNCLLDGPTLSSILEMINSRYESYPKCKVSVDFGDMWSDLVAAYKSPSLNIGSQLRITLDDKPPIDTGGVRRQVYSKVFQSFATNDVMKLFEGSENSLRPICTAESRSSGLFKILGTMVAHSICQDGVGFPYLSLTCYWYLIGGEQQALQFSSLQDIPGNSAVLIGQVCINM